MKAISISILLSFFSYLNCQINIDLVSISDEVDTMSSKEQIKVLFNKNSCLGCFVDIQKELDSFKYNYIVVLYKSNDYITNIKNLKQFKNIFINKNILFSNKLNVLDIRTPAIIIDKSLIPNEVLFHNGKLINNFYNIINKKLKKIPKRKS